MQDESTAKKDRLECFNFQKAKSMNKILKTIDSHGFRQRTLKDKQIHHIVI